MWWAGLQSGSHRMMRCAKDGGRSLGESQKATAMTTTGEMTTVRSFPCEEESGTRVELFPGAVGQRYRVPILAITHLIDTDIVCNSDRTIADPLRIRFIFSNSFVRNCWSQCSSVLKND